MIIGAFFRIALAIAILCFSPPDNLSPAMVSYPSGKVTIKSWQPAFLAASITSSFVASFLPILIFSKIVSSNKNVF